MNSISLRGQVPVKPTAQKALPKLIAALQPDSDDVIKIEKGLLTIHIGNCDAPSGFHEVACREVSDFCSKHAKAGAVLDIDGCALVVGPDERAKKDAHAAHLVSRIQALTSELDRLLKAA